MAGQGPGASTAVELNGRHPADGVAGDPVGGQIVAPPRVEPRSQGGRTRTRRGAGAGRAAQHFASSRTRIFFYDLGALVVLALLAWCYIQPANYPPGSASSPPSWEWWQFRQFVPESLRLPLYAFWFGAIGGIMISLKGIYEHSPSDWQEKYDLWHYGRPISGGIAGAITYLLLLAVSGSAPVEPAVLAAAFVMGTQERRFFNFLYEVARLVVQIPGDGPDTPLAVDAVRPPTGKEGDELTILGRGFAAAARVRIGDADLQDVVVQRDGTAITGNVPPAPSQASSPDGSADVLVINQDGAARLLKGAFRYVAPGTAPNAPATSVAPAATPAIPADGDTVATTSSTPADSTLPAVPDVAAAPSIPAAVVADIPAVMGSDTPEAPGAALASDAIATTPAGGSAAPSAAALAADGLPLVRTDPLLLDFGDQPVGAPSEDHTVRLINGGTTPLTIQRATLLAEPAVSFAIASELPQHLTLAPGEVWKLAVRFTPPSPGPFKAVLRFETADVAAPAATLPLTGMGVAT